MLKYRIPQIVTLTREKGIHFYFCPQYARNKIKIPHKQHVYKGISKEYSYSKRDLNPHSRNGQGILSPSCLPIPPFEHPFKEERKTRLELATLTLARLCSTN